MHSTSNEFAGKKVTLIVIAVFITIIIALIYAQQLPDLKRISDAESYIAMAQGRADEVRLHYARRILFPWVVGRLGFLAKIDSAVVITGVFSLLVFLYVLLKILIIDEKFNVIHALMIVCVPCILLTYRTVYLPHLFYLALSSLYFMLLIRGKFVGSLFLLGLLLLTRDEALLISASLSVILVMNIVWASKPRWRHVAYLSATLIITIAALLFLQSMTKNNSTMHGMPHVYSSLIRIFLYYLRNLTGIEFWVDTYRTLPFYVHEPLIVWNAPKILQNISIIRQYGIYQWEIMNVLVTGLYVLSAFGTGPTIILFYLKNKLHNLRENTLSFNVILFFGIVMVLLLPGMGPADLRYYTAAWPLFVLLMPVFLNKIKQQNTRVVNKLLVLYSISAWLLLIPIEFKSAYVYLFIIAVEVILHVITWQSLVKNRMILSQEIKMR